MVTDMIAMETGILVGTKLSGCYFLGSDALIAWEEDINEVLKAQQLNKMLALSPEKIAFGTIKNGVYIYNTAKKTAEKLNRETGLQNNTVLSMTVSKEQLWIGLDNGIDRVQLNAPITYYTDYSGIVGTVYDIETHEGTLYLGSNTGVYYFQEDVLKFVEGTQGHVWDLEVVNGMLLCGHNTGTFQIRDGVLEKISEVTGGYQLVEVVKEKDVFLQGTYTGMARFQENGAGEWNVRPVRNIDFPIKQLCFEDPSTVWGAHPYKGLYRMKINTTYDSVLTKRTFGSDEIPNTYNIRLFNIKNQIVLQSDGNWYKYDPILDKIVVFEEFRPYANRELLHYAADYFWFIDDGASKNMLYTDLKNDSLVIAESQLRKRLVPDAENVIRSNDSIYFFTLGDGFGKVNLSQLDRRLGSTTIPVPQLGFFKAGDVRYPIMGEPIKLLYNRSRDIAIQMVSPELIRPRFYYELSGGENRRSYINDGTINFQNLPYGDYELLVSTVGIDNENSEPVKVRFGIAPPWYWSNVSITGYLLALAGVVLLLRRYNRMKLQREHRKLEERLEKEQEERLALLEKEKLAKEIKLKTKGIGRYDLEYCQKE